MFGDDYGACQVYKHILILDNMLSVELPKPKPDPEERGVWGDVRTQEQIEKPGRDEMGVETAGTVQQTMERHRHPAVVYEHCGNNLKHKPSKVILGTQLPQKLQQ